MSKMRTRITRFDNKGPFAYPPWLKRDGERLRGAERERERERD